MKQIFIISLICILDLGIPLSSKSFMKNIGEIEQPHYMEKIITSNPTSVKATMKIMEEKKDDKKEEKSNELDFTSNPNFKEVEKISQSEMSKMVAPEIKRTNAMSQYNPFSVSSILAKDKIPSNLLSYSILYPTPESYYNERSVYVKDSHYKEYKEELLNKFRSSIQQILKNSNTKDDDFKQNFKKEILNNVINNNVVQTFSANSNVNPKNVYIQKSNPMKEIFG